LNGKEKVKGKVEVEVEVEGDKVATDKERSSVFLAFLEAISKICTR